jgi:uncharacterized protein
MEGTEFDPDKDIANQRQHGLSLSEAANFEWDTAVIREDRTERHQEYRFRAIGFLKDRLHVLVFTMREDRLRPISLRFATPAERRKWHPHE